MVTLEAFLLGFLFGIYGFVVGVILTAKGEILSFLHDFIQRLYEEGKIYHPIYKVTTGCPYCIAGFHCLIFICCIQPLLSGNLPNACFLFPALVTAIFTAFVLNNRYETNRL